LATSSIPPASAGAKGEEAGPGDRKPGASVISELPGLSASPKLLELTPGLYAVSIGESKVGQAELAGLVLPATQISGAMRGSDAQRVEIFPGGDGSDWIGPGGGTVVVKVPAAGGRILITTYRTVRQEAVPLAIQIARLDRPASALPAPSAATAEPSARMVKAEIILQLEKGGEQRVESGNWAGNRGQKQRIEAFAIRPLAQIPPEDIEYKGFGPSGRETPWVGDAKLCGSQGRGMALTGFAVRLSPRLRDKFDVVYEGAFFQSGVSPSRQNGEPCTGARKDDPLEALNIRFIQRASG
jgi:hypothetical protein